jgi:hypothetical protein
MKHSLLILAASAALIGASSAQAAPSRGHGPAIVFPGPAVESVTPPMESSVPPPVNPGTLSGPSEFGLPAVNSGTIVPLNQQTITNQPNFGALPDRPDQRLTIQARRSRRSATLAPRLHPIRAPRRRALAAPTQTPERPQA